MPIHRQTSIKVNAQVDEGVAELVSALSEISALETLESCQGGEDRPAFVIFRFGSWRSCGTAGSTSKAGVLSKPPG